MYDFRRMELQWPYMANKVYSMVRNCRSCPENRAHGKKQRQVKYFFADAPLAYGGMDILGSLSKIWQREPFVVVITDQYKNLTKPIPTAKLASHQSLWSFQSTALLVLVFFWKLHRDNSPRCLSNVFVACNMLVVNNINTTRYHPQTNGQLKRFNFTTAL